MLTTLNTDKPARAVWLKALALAGLCVLLAGCDVVFVSPLVVPKEAVADRRLVGRWLVRAGGDEGYITIKQSGTKLLVASVTAKTLKNKLPPGFYTVACNGQSFMVAAYKGTVKDKKYPGYMVIKYKIEGETLSLSLPHPAAFQAALKEGKLHGTAGAAFDSTLINDPARDVWQFLCAADEKSFSYLGKVQRAD